MPGGVVVVETNDNERRLTVESVGPPGWSEVRPAVSYTLSDDDRTYLLWSDGSPDRVPWLTWPAVAPRYRAVIGVDVVAEGDRIVSDVTATDLGIPDL